MTEGKWDNVRVW